MLSIYKITNTKNGKAYIGSTVRPLQRRMSNHWSDARNGKQTLIATAIREFGKDSFNVEVIAELASEDEMMAQESEAIISHGTLFPNGYNSTASPGLWSPGIGFLKSVREKISRASMGKVISPEHRQKLSDSSRGRVPPNKGIKTGKPSWNRGIAASEECRAKLRAYHAENLSPNARPIEYLDVIHPSIAEAARVNGLSLTQMKYLLRIGKAQYYDAPNGGYQDPKLPERCKTACPKCGGPYSKFISGQRYCTPCRLKKMMEAQRKRRAAKKNNQPEIADITKDG